MKDIQYEIVKEIAVLSASDSGYTKGNQLNFMERERAKSMTSAAFPQPFMRRSRGRQAMRDTLRITRKTVIFGAKIV